MQVELKNTNLDKVGDVELPDDVFAIEVKEAILWQEVNAQRARKRRGTHCTKTRDEVRGTGAKPMKQKGSGRARQGSNRAPQFVGGGVVMGPRPRDYSYRLPRTARRAALKTALSARVKSEGLVVLDAFGVDTPKTSTIKSFLDKLGSHSALVVDVDNGTLNKSMRNLPKSKYLAAEGLNVYDILNHDKLVLTQAALQAVVAKALGENTQAQA